MQKFPHQLSALAIASRRAPNEAQLRASRTRESTDQLRIKLDKALDHHRFNAAYGIGQPLDLELATKMLDDFLIVEAAEKHEPTTSKVQLYAFVLVRNMLRERIDGRQPFTVDDAKAVHRSADLARARIKSYSVPALVAGCIEMNKTYAKRGDPFAFRPKPNTRNVLQLPGLA
jgi:hypothetical protein